MSFPQKLLMARQSTFETRAALNACLLQDVPTQRVELKELDGQKEALCQGDTLPMGSVEYVQHAMRLAGIAEPANLSYHPSIYGFLGREIRATTVGEQLYSASTAPIFIKPQATKTFTGFVLNGGRLDKHDADQLRIMCSLPGPTPLWTSPVVDFMSEWRVYVMAGEIIGLARYDDREELTWAPDQAVIGNAVGKAWDGLQHPFALDVGVLADGQTVVVELNDAWSIGLYGGPKSLSGQDYLRYLFARWKTLKKQAA